MTDMAAMDINLKMQAHNFELINAKRTKESLVHGKLYVDVNAMLKGRPDALTMRGNMNILGNSDFTYVLKDSPLTVEDRLNETVTFVDFSDTTHIEKPNMPVMSLGGMDILMTLHIDEAVQARVDLNDNGSNYMLLEGGGDLSFQYQPDGNMLLNGRYSLMSGEMKYEMPIIPLKTFYIQDGSYIEWTGNLMNPNLNIKASERVRASVSSDGGESTRMVNFDVGVNLTNRLENLGFTFTLEAPDAEPCRMNWHQSGRRKEQAGSHHAGNRRIHGRQQCRNERIRYQQYAELFPAKRNQQSGGKRTEKYRYQFRYGNHGRKRYRKYPYRLQLPVCQTFLEQPLPGNYRRKDFDRKRRTAAR